MSDPVNFFSAAPSGSICTNVCWTVTPYFCLRSSEES